jgi:single-strand DNA-binding protein
MQFISITGRVGGDAETRSAGSGTVTNFNCAVDQGWGDNKQTNWFRVAIWGDRGSKLAQYIKKGEKVAVTGELVIGEYQGEPQYEIRAAEIDPFMSAKAREPDGSRGAPTPRQPVVAFDTDLDDNVPFVSCDPALEHRVG